MQHHKKTLALLLVVWVTVALAAPAWAQDTQSGNDAYRSGGENIAGQVQGGGGESAGATETGGTLPFTGLDLALIVGVGGLLMAAGLGTRRLTRHAGTS